LVVKLEDRKLRLFTEAEEMGLGEVAEELRAAHRLTEEASKHLEKALSLGEG